MRASNQPRDGEDGLLDGRHLSEEELNRLIDGDLAPDAREQAVDHLAHCDHCRRIMADLQMVATMLSTLPQIDAPRSFQLDPSHGSVNESFWDRWGALLLPFLPAMRAGTVALALALGGVTAYRVVEDQPVSEQVQEQAGSRMQPTSTEIAALVPTDVTKPKATQGAAPEITVASKTDRNRDQSSDAAAGAPAESAADEETSADATTATEDQPNASTQLQPPTSGQSADASGSAESSGVDDASVMIAMEAASPAASPTATSSATATATSTAIPTATPMPTVSATQTAVTPTVGNDRSWLGWLQVVLGALLVGLGALLIGVTRFRHRLS